MHVSPFATSVPGKTVKLPQCVVKMVYTHWSLYYLTGLRRLCLLGSRGDSEEAHSSGAVCGVELCYTGLGHFS